MLLRVAAPTRELDALRNMSWWLLFQSTLQHTNLSPDLLHCVLRFFIRSAITHVAFLVDPGSVHGQHDSTHKKDYSPSVLKMQRLHRSSRVKKNNKELNCILISACPRKDCGSVCFHCAVSNHQHRYRVRSANVAHVRRITTDSRCGLIVLHTHSITEETRNVCTNSCTGHGLTEEIVLPIKEDIVDCAVRTTRAPPRTCGGTVCEYPCALGQSEGYPGPPVMEKNSGSRAERREVVPQEQLQHATVPQFLEETVEVTSLAPRLHEGNNRPSCMCPCL